MIRSHRQARKRSLTWLARTTGMDTGYLSRMERGRLSTLPLPDTIDRLATALELGATERRALYTAVGKLTEEMYRLALRVQGSTQLYRLAIILASLPTVALLTCPALRAKLKIGNGITKEAHTMSIGVYRVTLTKMLHKHLEYLNRYIKAIASLKNAESDYGQEL